MLYFSSSYKEKNHHFILSQFQSRNGINKKILFLAIPAFQLTLLFIK